jgi:hypothetical protein
MSVYFGCSEIFRQSWKACKRLSTNYRFFLRFAYTLVIACNGLYFLMFKKITTNKVFLLQANQSGSGRGRLGNGKRSSRDLEGLG